MFVTQPILESKQKITAKQWASSEMKYSKRTEDAEIFLLNNTYKKIDEYVICLFLDLPKVFDTVNHLLLSDRFPGIGLRGIALDDFIPF